MSDSNFAALAPGIILAERYHVQEALGEGTSAAVYLAHDEQLGHKVALKVLDPLRGTDPVGRSRFEREYRVLSRLTHPNIARCHALAKDGDMDILVMEFIEGETLADRLVSGRIRYHEAVAIAASLADALCACHAAGVLHRDLKPANIMLHPERGPVILDFGVAWFSSAMNLTRTGATIGTPRYMAPEQITHASSVGPAADLYSVSVLFYELLVDVLPQGHWQPPSGGRSDVPAAIDALIEKGLSNRPASRPQAATEYRKALVDAVNLGPSVRKQNGADKPTGLPLNNNIMKWAGIGSAALVALILIFSLVPDDTGPGPGPIDPCDGLYGEALSACLGIDPEPEPGPGPVKPDPIRPDPPPTPIQSLSGRWDDGLGSLYNIRVNRNGSFSGTGTGADGTALQLSGRFEGVNGTYTLTAPAFGMSFNGSLVWDQGCHINYRTTDIYGNAIQGQLHVNHTPGAPCPA
mgnify:CR=1 FL=1